MVLQVGHVGAMAFQHLHGLQGGWKLPGSTEVVAVQVQRVRQAEVIDDLARLRHDLGRASPCCSLRPA